MKENLKMVLTLVVIAALSGAVLAKVYDFTQPKIKKQHEKAIESAVYAVVPQATGYEVIKDGDFNIYKCYGEDKDITGYAFLAEGTGYQDIIVVMVGLDKSLSEITGIEVLENQETPGLGAKITAAGFKDQFKGIDTSGRIELTKEAAKGDNQVEAITGATISSEAVVDMVNKYVEKTKDILPKQD